MVRHIITKQAHDLLEAHALTGKIAPAEPIASMPGYVWVDLDEEVSNKLRNMIDWQNVGDDAKSEADAYSALIVRLCTKQLGRG